MQSLYEGEEMWVRFDMPFDLESIGTVYVMGSMQENFHGDLDGVELWASSTL